MSVGIVNSIINNINKSFKNFSKITQTQLKPLQDNLNDLVNDLARKNTITTITTNPIDEFILNIRGDIQYLCFHIYIPALIKLAQKRNKTLLFYLILLQLSNKKGFCYIQTKFLLESAVFDITNRKTVYSYINILIEEKIIKAIFDKTKNHWIIHLNTPYHRKLLKSFLKNHQNEDFIVENYHFVEECLNDEEMDEVFDDDFDDDMDLDNVNMNMSDDGINNKLLETNNIEYKGETITMNNNLNNNDDIDELYANPMAYIKNFNIEKEMAERARGKKVLLVTPYKTRELGRNCNDDEHIKYTIDVIDGYEKNFNKQAQTALIPDFYPLANNPEFKKDVTSPIRIALDKAQKEIEKIKKENYNFTIEEEYKIKQQYLNDVNFLDENLIKSIDKIYLIPYKRKNYKGIVEINEIRTLANKFNKPIEEGLLIEEEWDEVNCRKSDSDTLFHIHKGTLKPLVCKTIFEND